MVLSQIASSHQSLPWFWGVFSEISGSLTRHGDVTYSPSSWENDEGQGVAVSLSPIWTT